jgi:hypothetical protein
MTSTEKAILEATGWKADEGYSGCITKRWGEIAVVICPPEYGDDWGFQAFDESDEEAIACGQRAFEGYGYEGMVDVLTHVENLMA